MGIFAGSFCIETGEDNCKKFKHTYLKTDVVV